MELVPTPSQTVGPFFHVAYPPTGSTEMVARNDPDAVVISGTVFDGDGAPAPDAFVEFWQANRAGRYAHPDDERQDVPLEEGFEGFGRCATDDEGRYEFVTVKPGRVPGPGGGLQAPHIAVSVFARGLLKRVVTRIYWPDEPEANASDPILSSIEDPRARETLVARAVDGGGLRFDIHLQGEGETAFFDI
jgi:protocatechuate 3,4-dioxygenase alpha subunit